MGRKGKPLSAAHKAAISRALKGKSRRGGTKRVESAHQAARRMGTGARFVGTAGQFKRNPLVSEFYKRQNNLIRAGKGYNEAKRSAAKSMRPRKARMPKQSPQTRAMAPWGRGRRPRNFVMYD